MNNTRFATAMHIMILLAKSPQEWLTSEWMAGSININPAVVRKEISVLREAGLIVSRKGKDGGSRLSLNPEAISLSAIYAAVKNTELLGKKNQNPNPVCNVGREINDHLGNLFSEADQLVLNFLGDQSLQQFSDRFE